MDIITPVRRVVATLRRPEYTGDNRCLPCTVLNILLAALASGLIGFVSLPAMVGSFGLFVGLIYLRGYLVPGTPWLTKRYLPTWVLTRFEHGSRAATPHEGEGTNEPPDAETLLREAGIVVTCENGSDVCLVPEFCESWHERMQAVKTEHEHEIIADLLDVDSGLLSFRHPGPAVVASYEGRPVGQWESSAALVADVAINDELEIWYDGWEDLAVNERARILKVFRVFIEKCPACGGSISLAQKEVESC